MSILFSSTLRRKVLLTRSVELPVNADEETPKAGPPAAEEEADPPCASSAGYISATAAHLSSSVWAVSKSLVKK